MPNDIANYIIAQRAGTPLHRYLDAETLGQVGEFEARLASKEGGGGEIAIQSPRRRARTTPATKELRLDRIRVPSGALTQKRMDEAVRMAAVYPILYAFENSLREFTDGHLSNAYGDKWHDDPKIVNTTIRARVERNRNAEVRHRYHSRRTERFIYYTDLGDLPLIAHSENGWKVFKSLLPSDKWLPGIVEKIEASRNVVAHMNPLARRDINRITLNFEDWLDQIKEHPPSSVP